MSEQTEDTGARPEAGGGTIEDRDYVDILKALAGKVVTIVNPESYEAAPMGYRLKEGFYRAKVTAVGRDYIAIITDFERKKTEKERVKQFIPLSRIKRVSLMKSDNVLHL